MSSPTPKEIRAARAYLYQHGIGYVRPIQFAASAKEQNVSFKVLHKILEPWLRKARKSTTKEEANEGKKAMQPA